MTQPVSHGYPDHGRYSARADKFINSQSSVTIDASETYGRFFVGDIDFLGLRFFAQTNHFSFQVSFYESQTSTLPFGNQTFSIRENGSLDLTIPVTGPWVEYVIAPSAVDSIFTQRSWTAHSATFGALLSYNAPIIASTNQSIAAGASLTVSTTKVWPGEAHWFTESAVATWTSRIETIDYLGNTIIIDEFRATAAGDKGRQIFLPPINVQLIITNQSAGAGTFRAAIVARPIEPGR